MTNEGDWVFDPFSGTGTSIIAAIRHGRCGAGADTESRYIDLATQRITSALADTLPIRPMGKPVYDPQKEGNKLATPPWSKK
jgi:adenine-specific DNA-methyltransferase